MTALSEKVLAEIERLGKPSLTGKPDYRAVLKRRAAEAADAGKEDCVILNLLSDVRKTLKMKFTTSLDGPVIRGASRRIRRHRSDCELSDPIEELGSD